MQFQQTSSRHFQKNKTARQVWTPQSKAEGVHRVLVFFEKNDGSPAATTPVAIAPPAAAPATGGPVAPAKAPINAAGAPAAAPPAQAAKPPAAPAAAAPPISAK